MIYSQHYCTRCRKYFNADMTDLADPGSHYTRRVIDAAVRLVIEDGLPYRTASWTLWREHRVFVPYATIQNWVEAGGEKGDATDRPTDYLDWALSDFSGYIAADELYDGPFCILSIVDNRTFQRLAYQVLDHDPTHKDIEAFFRRFHRGPGGARPGPQGDHDRRLVVVSRADRHGLRRGAASGLHLPCPQGSDQGGPLRRRQAPQGPGRRRPKLPRGRPGSKAARRAARRKKRIEAKVGELFEHRYLFVRHHLTASERKTLARITRGQPQLAHPARPDGGGLSPLRPAVPDGDGVGQAGATAGAVAAIRPAARGVEEAVPAGPGEGVGVPGREVAGGDIERGGAREPPVPEDAEDGVPGADAAVDRGHGWRWTCFESDTPGAGL